MVQLITFLLVMAALIVLVLQNLTPVLGLVVLGQSTLMLPLSIWLLGAIAAGSLCTLTIDRLVPQKRPYRPMGKRLNEPPPATKATDRNPYDTDWENFRAPEQWDDWGQQQTSVYGPRNASEAAAQGAQDGQGTVRETVRDIESGWDDDYYGDGYRDGYGNYPNSAPASHPSSIPTETRTTRTYEDGWLYGSESLGDPSGSDSTEVAKPEESGNLSDDALNNASDNASDDNVYDADYRVIIPPYDPSDRLR